MTNLTGLWRLYPIKRDREVGPDRTLMTARVATGPLGRQGRGEKKRWFSGRELLNGDLRRQHLESDRHGGQ